MTDSLVQSGVGNLRKTFQNSDRLQASVTLDDLDYDASTNSVTPSITIENGPLVEVETTGAKVSKGQLRH